MSQPTKSEMVLARYFADSAINAYRMPESDEPEPDYRVDVENGSVYLEVKEFGRPKPFPTGGFSPLPYIRRRIDKAREKFPRYRDNCCCVVLYNEESMAAHLNPSAVMSAMFGELYQRSRNDEISFFGSAMLTASKNTSISAVVTLRPLALHPLTLVLGEQWYEQSAKLGRELTDDEIRVIEAAAVRRSYNPVGMIMRATVFKNPYAHHQIPDTLFRGPFDESWEQSGEAVKYTFRGERLSKLWQVLPDYMRLPLSVCY